MLTKKEVEEARAMSLKYFEKAGIVLTEDEKKNIEVVDFGLSDLQHSGVQVLTYFNTSKLCGRELVLFPKQTCPEHRHPPVGDYAGKEEIFRCRWGKVYLYVAGKRSSEIHASLPPDQKQYYTVWHEVILNPGGQYVAVAPDTLHWFQAGPEGAVLSEFTTQALDYDDIWTNPNIERKIVIK